jgi:hypothetical protein
VTTSATTGGHEEHAAEHVVEAHTAAVPAFANGEGYGASEDVRRAVAEREKRDPCHGWQEAQRGREALEGGAKVLGRGVTDEVEEHHQPEQERGVPGGRRRSAEAAVEEAEPRR